MLTRATSLVRRNLLPCELAAPQRVSRQAIRSHKRLCKVANSARPRFFCYVDKIWTPTTHVPHLEIEGSTSLKSPPSRANQLQSLLNQSSIDGDAVISLVKEMIELHQHLAPQMVRNLFSQLGTKGLWTNSSILRSLLLSHDLYTSKTYQLELGVCKQCDNLEEALQLYQWWHKHSNAPPQRFELILLLELHVTPAFRLPHDATNLFQSFIEAGLRNVLGTAGFNTLIQVWASVGPSALVDDRIRAIYQEMEAVHSKNGTNHSEEPTANHKARHKENRNLCRPDSKTYELMVSNLQEMSLVERFYRIALKEGKTSPKVHERYLFRLCASSKQKARAMSWYRQMLEHPRWRKEITEETLLTILHFCTVTGDMAGTRSVFSDATELGIAHTTSMYASLISLCARMKNTQMAETIMVEELPRHGLEMDENIYSALILLYCAIDNLPKAATIYQEMQAIGCPILENSLTPLIIGYFEKARSTQNPKMEAQAQYFWEHRKAIKVKPTLHLLVSIFVNSIDTAFLSNLSQDLLSFIDGIQPLHNLTRRIFYSESLLSPERALFVLSKFTLIPEFRIEHWMYDMLFRKLADHNMISIALQLAQEALDIAFFLNWDSAFPTSLYWTSGECVRKSKQHKYPFHLTDTHASALYQNIVAPNGLKSSVDWSLRLNPISKKPWDKETAFAWSADLSSWMTQLRGMNLD